MTEPGAKKPDIWARLYVRPEEVKLFIWSFVFVFTLMFSYYILRPIRDTVGLTGGVKHLSWLFLGTMVTTLILNIPFSALVKKWPSVKFVPVVYTVFAMVILAFAFCFTVPSLRENVWMGRIFFIWISVYNLYTFSLFWQFMVDVFEPEQGKRLFGMFASGTTLGAIAGAACTSFLIKILPEYVLIYISGSLLLLALFFVNRIRRLAPAVTNRKQGAGVDKVIGGSIWKGFTSVFQSKYLLLICVYMLIYSISATLLYMRQANLVTDSFGNVKAHAPEITSFFARIDLAVNILALITGTFITGSLLRKIGVKYTMSLLSLICIAGFGLLAFIPTLTVLSVFQVFRRSADYAVARPSRELLFTVVSREDKYKTKSVIDTGVYRLGDQVGAWSSTLFSAIGFSGFLVSLIGAGLSMVWFVNSWWLGRRQQQLEKAGTLHA